MPGSRSPGRSEPRGARAPAGWLLALVILLGCSGGGSAPAPNPEVTDTESALTGTGNWWPSTPPADRWFPVGAVVLPTGTLVVADSDQNRLFRITSRGGLPLRLPEPGRRPVAWTALALAPGLSFYALDGPGRVVHQYDFQGNYLGIALDIEVVARELELGPVEPAGLAVDRAGHALITDRMGDRILVFGPGFSYLGVWGQTGSDEGSWRRPGAVAVGSRGPYLVSDYGNQRIMLLDSLGDVLAVRDLTQAPRGVAALGDGLFAVSYGRFIEVLDGTLATIETHLLPIVGNCEGGPFVTTALAGGAGTLIAGEGCSGRLLEVRLGGG